MKKTSSSSIVSPLLLLSSSASLKKSFMNLDDEFKRPSLPVNNSLVKLENFFLFY